MLEDKVMNQLNCEVARVKLDVSILLNKCVDLEYEWYRIRDELYTMPKHWVRKIAVLSLKFEAICCELEQSRVEHKEALDKLAIAQTALDEYVSLTPIEQTKVNLCHQLMVLSEIKEDYNQYDELSDTAQHELSCLEQDIVNIKIQLEQIEQNLNNPDDDIWENVKDGDILELTDGLFRVSFNNDGVSLEKFMYRVYCDPCFET